VLDEVGYVPLAEIGAEFLFQVIAERAGRNSNAVPPSALPARAESIPTSADL